MHITIIGIGMGNPDLLTIRAMRAIQQSRCLIGAQRLLNCFPDVDVEKVPASVPAQIAEEVLRRRQLGNVTVIVSGDVGFYSAAKGLMHLLGDEQVELIPGISSLQYFCARLGISWEDISVLSLHGREQDLIGTICANEETFLLTGGKFGAAEICARFCENALGDLAVSVGERLSYPDERISQGTAEQLCGETFDPLAVMLVRNRNMRRRSRPATHGIPDEAFLRGNVPMTKAEVRAVSISKLCLEPGWMVWDVGAGTGSVSVEVARVLPDGLVFAVEREQEACKLIEQNRIRFSLPNLQIIQGTAPDALSDLPAPDAVFIGGSSGGLSASVELAVQKNPAVRVVVNAITLETVGAALEAFNRLELTGQEIVQVFAARSKTVGSSHMMTGQNPVYILSAGGKDAWKP